MKRPLLIFLVTLLAYGLTAAGHLFSPDEEILFRMTRSLATGAGASIEPLETGAGSFGSRAPRPPRADGREYGQYGIGQPLLAVPFYWIGIGIAGWRDDAGWQRLYGAEPFSPADLGVTPTAMALATRSALSWFNILVGALLALLLYFLALHVGADPRAATWAALLYALGSMAWPHSRTFFTEPLATLMIVAAWLALLRGVNSTRLEAWCALAGAAAGYAFLVRNDSALAYPGLALVMLGPVVEVARSRARSHWRAWIAFAAPALLCALVQFAMNWARFGDPLATGYSDQPEGVAFRTPLIAGLYGLLFSAGKGIFFFSPALVASLAGWAILFRRRPVHAFIPWGLALAVLVPLLIHAKWQNWAGGWTWGPRHIFIIHAFLVPPLALWLTASWGRFARALCIVLLGIGIGVNLMGSLVNFNAFHHRFFRSPGDRDAYFVLYDEYDRGYWQAHYQLLYRPTPQGEWQPVPLFPPAPIQHSLFVPQQSVWNGYPRMIREGQVDNLWLRLMRGDTAR